MSQPMLKKECYMFLAGRNTTADGTMLCGHNNDLQGHNAALYELLPRTVHTNKTIELPSGLLLPQPEETKACLILKTWRGYVEGDAVAINEHQVAIAGGVDLGNDRNETVRAADPLVPEGVSGAVRYLALQQSTTARECVERIGNYYSKYGISYTCGVGIVDTDEAWYLEAGGGHSWVAVRVPDDCYMAQANGYRIGEIDPDDSANCICSPGLFDFCAKKGLWERGKSPFHFARIFGGRMRQNPKLTHFNTRRIWGALRLLNPSTSFDPDAAEYPLFLKPEQQLTVPAIMKVLRDHYADTSYDAFPEEGGYGRDRPICVPSCVHSDVIELRKNLPAEIGAILWGALASPATSPYLPFYFGVKRLPEAYSKGDTRFSTDAAFWRYRSLSNLSLVDFRQFGLLLRARWQSFEDEIFTARSALEAAAKPCFTNTPSMSKELLTSFTNQIADGALRQCIQLEAELQTRIAENIHLRFSEPELGW